MSWQGFDVLSIEPSREGAIEERIQRRFALLDTKTGKRAADEFSAVPAPVRPFVWIAFGREEIANLRAFLAARKGSAVPFWLPSYQADLSLAEDVLKDAAIATIRRVRFHDLLFPGAAGRRHLAFYGIGTGLTFHKVLEADDPGDGITESLTIDPVAPRLYPAASTVISFLKLCRLENDEVSIEYPSTEVARAEIRAREIPLEAPE